MIMNGKREAWNKAADDMNKMAANTANDWRIMVYNMKEAWPSRNVFSRQEWIMRYHAAKRG